MVYGAYIEEICIRMKRAYSDPMACLSNKRCNRCSKYLNKYKD